MQSAKPVPSSLLCVQILIQKSRTIRIQLTNISNAQTPNVQTYEKINAILQHDTLRIMQAAVEFGNDAQRKIRLPGLEDILLDVMNRKHGRCKLIQALCVKGAKDYVSQSKLSFRFIFQY